VRRGQPRSIALGAAHLATLVRRHRPVLLRWIWLSGSGALCGILAVRNNRLEGTAARTVWLTCLVPGLLFGAAGLLGPLARSAARAHWMLVSCGVSAGERRLAIALAMLPPALALGAVAGTLSGLVVSGFWQQTLLGMLAAGCAVLVAVTAGLGAMTGTGRDATALLIRMAVVGGLLMLVTWRFRVLGLVVTTALVSGLTARLATAREDALRSARIAQQATE
jgi:hypothetical protein